MTALFAAAHRHPGMRDVYLEYYGHWIEAGGDMMNQYNDVGPGRSGACGARSSTSRRTRSPLPKYRGLLDFIAANPTAR